MVLYLLTLFHQVAIIVDGMIDSGKTLSMAAQILHENGAESVHALISHGTTGSYLKFPSLTCVRTTALLSEDTLSVVEKLPLQQLVVCTYRLHFAALLD
jgi:ribose-phosphate pyrophosphokinase